LYLLQLHNFYPYQIWCREFSSNYKLVKNPREPNRILLLIAKFLYNCRMIELNIPGRGTIRLEHLVCDVNGTLALDGQLLDGLPRYLADLKDRLEVHLLTADTHGGQAVIDQQLGLKAHRVQTEAEAGPEALQKADFVQQLGASRVVAIGQGANDSAMLEAAIIGIGVLSPEGISHQALLAADILVPDIYAAIELLEKPLRMVATLRK
jgi:soluble P-type ATPase